MSDRIGVFIDKLREMSLYVHLGGQIVDTGEHSDTVPCNDDAEVVVSSPEARACS